MTSPIIDFIEARLAEDEAAAHAALDPERPGTHWQWVNDETDEPIGNLDEDSAIGGLSLRTVEQFVRGEAIGSYAPSPLPAFVIYTAEEIIPGAGDHIARHDPARVLREVEAKRRILAWAQDDTKAGPEAYPPDDIVDVIRDGALAPVLRMLAAVYSDHPEFDPEWTVTA